MKLQMPSIADSAAQVVRNIELVPLGAHMIEAALIQLQNRSVHGDGAEQGDEKSAEGGAGNLHVLHVSIARPKSRGVIVSVSKVAVKVGLKPLNGAPSLENQNPFRSYRSDSARVTLRVSQLL